MCVRQLSRAIRIALFISLAIVLLSANVALAQKLDLRASKVGSSSITAEWDAMPEATSYDVHYKSDTSTDWNLVTSTTETSYSITGLRPDTTYSVRVWYKGDLGQGYSIRDMRTAKQIRIKKHKSKKSEPKELDTFLAPSAPPITCPYLPSSVVITGYARSTQCQMVGEAGVGRIDVIKRGFIDAVDIWSYVNGGLEVCFRSAGSLVFLDADYAPRMIVELASYERDGMTCGRIDGAGTVALVRSGPPAATAAPPAEATPPPPGEPTLPAFDAIPLSDCQIKLQETLFLRAQPAGEIIGLVWLYSEVRAFEINGYWYKIEFEGQSGYISRYHREVLRGGCG